MTHEVLVRRTKRGRDKKKRQMNPNSMKNLVPPVQPGEVRNPTGTNGRKRLYTDEYQLTGESETPDQVRLIWNIQLHLKLRQIRIQARQAGLPQPLIKALDTQMKMEILPKGIIWAKACSIRMHMNAVIEGDVSAMTEIRESVEGRATQRIEFGNTNSRLELLLDEFREARKNPPKKPDPESK